MEKNNLIREKKARISSRDYLLSREVALDIAFPDRKDSKTEQIKGEIMDLYHQIDELEGKEKVYSHLREPLVEEPELTEDEKKILELEAQLAALRG